VETPYKEIAEELQKRLQEEREQKEIYKQQYLQWRNTALILTFALAGFIVFAISILLLSKI
jgi:hypothetical protein